MNAGSAVPSMTTDILNSIELVIPSEYALDKFGNLVDPIYRIIHENNSQSNKLGKIRDCLLPWLMSGELDVSSLNI